MNKVELVDVNLEDNYSVNLKEAYQKVDSIIESYNTNGYRVVSVTPLTGSGYHYDDNEKTSYGYGYSFTTGILIVFEEIQED